jgi:hypothetical protein
MNGIISYDTGGGVVIEGDTITATGVISDNITCETLEVNTSATFNGTASFDTALPTSVITSATSDDQFITKAIGDTLYAGSSLLGDNNVWTGTNAFNTSLPTSTLTGTPTATQIAPVAMLNNLYASLVAGGYARLTSVVNTFTNNNIFQGTINCTSTATLASLQTLFISWSAFSGDIVEQTFDTLTGIFKTLSYNGGSSPRFDFAFLTNVIPIVEVVKFRIQETVSTFFTRVQVLTPDTANTNSTALSLTNSNATPTSLNMSLSWNSGVNGIIQAGDTAIIARTVLDSATTALVLAPWSNTTCGVRITKDDVTLHGLTNNFSATTTNITGATNFTSLPSTTTSFTSATSNQFITKNIGDTLYADEVSGGYARLTTVDNAFTNNNTFVNLPSTTTSFTTASANQFITKNIGDTLYADEVGGGYARLTTVDNSFTNNNAFGGTTTTINSTNLVVSTSTATTFVNLPSTTTSFTTASANQFITKNIGDQLYADEVGGGYARLTSVGNAFTNNNTFNSFLPTTTITAIASTNQFAPVVALDGRYAPSNFSSIYARVAYANAFTSTNSFSSTTDFTANDTNFTGANVTIATGNNTIRSKNSGQSAFASLSVRNANSSKIIFFFADTTNNNQNAITEAGDCLISSYGLTGSALTLTSSSTNNVGVRIDGSNNAMFINGGLTTIDNNVNGATANPILMIKNTATIQSRIGFHLHTSVAGQVNPMVGVGENVIYSGDNGTGSGTKSLNLTVQSTTACGIKINRSTSNVLITGASTTINTPITIGYTTAPTFTASQIGYTFESPQYTWDGPNATQVYQSPNLITIPTQGVWKVDAYLRVHTASRPVRYFWSISPYNLLPTHDINRVSTDVYDFLGSGGTASVYLMTTYTKFHATGTMLAGTVSATQSQPGPPFVPWTYGYYYVYTRLG